MSQFEGIDFTSMESMVDAFPKLIGSVNPPDELLEKAKEMHEKELNGICLLGMGGSSIAGAYCKALYHTDTEIPIEICRGYFLPKYVNHDWAVIAVSYSGNTEETLSSLRMAKERDCEIFGITSGGKLKHLIKQERLMEIIPEFQPRAALPILLSYELPLIESLIGREITNLKELEVESIDIRVNSEFISSRNLTEKIINKQLLFIGAEHLLPVAYRAKCQVNENAKTLAFHAEIPESNHNEIESSGDFSKADIVPIFLKSQNLSKRILDRIHATIDIYKDEGAIVFDVESCNSTKLPEMLALTFYLDKVSLDISKHLEADSTRVERISRLKRKLSSPE